MRIYLNDNVVYKNPEISNIPFIVQKDYMSSKISLDVKREVMQYIYLNNAYLDSIQNSSSRFFNYRNTTQFTTWNHHNQPHSTHNSRVIKKNESQNGYETNEENVKVLYSRNFYLSKSIIKYKFN